MADLLLEIYSEDIPAWMQDSAVRTLAPRIVKELEDAGVSSEERESFVTPRRMALIVRGLPAVQPARSDERKGPRVSAPDKAIQGFLRSVGVKSVDGLETRDDGKGEFYVSVTRSDERPLSALLAEKIPDVLMEFPWAKSMRWGDGTFRWARPLRSILCVFDGAVVPFEVAGIAADNVTRGHPVMAPGAITVGGAGEYQDKLKKAHVHLTRRRRREVIRDGLAAIAKKHGVDFVEDDGLVAETAGQTEWPVVLSGGIDAQFMGLPEKLLISVMRTHQQNFAFRDKKTGKLAPLFAAVADVEAPDGGKAIVAGNEAVLRARFADARFYWDADCKVSLEEHKEKSDKIILYHVLNRCRILTSVGDKIKRIRDLADIIYSEEDRGEESDEFFVTEERDLLDQTLPFLKFDLSTETVREFPELQGVMGYHLLLNGNFEKEGVSFSEELATILKEHYAPTGPSDVIPSSHAGRVAALADKLDTLICFFAVGGEPTGSGDPHGLRRAALGVIRIILEGEMSLNLSTIIRKHETKIKGVHKDIWIEELKKRYPDKDVSRPLLQNVEAYLLDFIKRRLIVYLRDSRGVPHDVVDAVLRPIRGKSGAKWWGIGRPLWSVRLIYALTEFINTDDGTNLLAGYKRADNILQIEGRKDVAKEKQDTPQDADQDDDSSLDLGPFREEGEKNLANALEVAENKTATALNKDDFAAAMTALAKLRQPLDAFFDSVTVNDANEKLRANRLKLLSQVLKVMHQVADFSRIEGGERKKS